MEEIGGRWWGMLMAGGGALATETPYLLHYRGRIWPAIAAVMGPVQLSKLSQALKPAPARGPDGRQCGDQPQPHGEGAAVG